MWRRLLNRIFKGYQLMLLEPEGGQTVRHMRINIASILAIVLIIAGASAAVAWHYAPGKTETISARYYQLQQQNHDLRDQQATGEGELAVAQEQIEGLKTELVSSQQQIEELRQAKNIYESILEARKSSGVHILRASARIEDGNMPESGKKISYSIVLVKGGNYPRSVSGRVRIVAHGTDGQKEPLQLDAKSAELQYTMDTHLFLEGSATWKQAWQPTRLQITRMNAQGAERDEMEIDLDGNTTN